jgi:beta-mannosidase
MIMYRQSLSGEWMLRDLSTHREYPGHLPGCNYLDLINCNAIDDPFWGDNEVQARKIADKDFSYSRVFHADDELLCYDRVILQASGIDTLAEISINGRPVAQCDNAHRTYRFAIKDALKSGENEINIIFRSPIPYIHRMKKERPVFSMSFGEVPAYVRKPHYHFGWDWGPVLPPVGIHGRIEILGQNEAVYRQVKITQQHRDGNVTLQIASEIDKFGDTQSALCQTISVYAPDGRVIHQAQYPIRQKDSMVEAAVANAELWWCNGLGKQPLYRVEAALNKESGGTPLDSREYTIGLRAIELDTSPDKYGNTFRFIINDVPIFSKGADWIPPDSFVTRTGRDDLEFYIKSAATANMNMLRVWGGGYYAADDFFDLCDQYGILVWQDCAFACSEYPFDEAFLKNIEQEIYDNVTRLRHHASLALWCGNNEVEAFFRFMKKPARETHKEFFYKTLKDWIEKEDNVTPYWAGSPSSGSPNESSMLVEKGDNHLWQVWHGMKPIEYYAKLPVRFCSEFGLEAMPSIKAIRSFTDSKELSIKEPAVRRHQKSTAGNEKMQFYMLSKYRSPAAFDDFVYLSQLIQAESIRMATEGWRRQRGRCNGALFWQYNDCWPTASWSCVDYMKQFKALQYRARYFNSMLCLSMEFKKGAVAIYGINDYATPVQGILQLRFVGFDGTRISESSVQVTLSAIESKLLAILNLSEQLKGHPKKNAAIVVTFFDESGSPLFRQNALLVPDKKAGLQKPVIAKDVTIEDTTATLTLRSDTYARYVCVEADGIEEPFTDNYFDLEAGREYSIQFPVPHNTDTKSLAQSITVRTLADVPVKGTAFGDSIKRFMFRLKPYNFLTWLLYKFI